MFDTPHIALKVTDVTHSRRIEGEKEVPVVHVELELNPLTAEMCAEVSPFMKNTLFTMSDAAVNPQMLSANFAIIDREQILVARSAPDAGEATWKAEAVTISPVSARRGKSTTAWKLVFTASWEPSGERQLALVIDSLTKVRYITFADQVPNLVTEVVREERAARRVPRNQQTAH